MVDEPGNTGLPSSNSPRMQPGGEGTPGCACVRGEGVRGLRAQTCRSAACGAFADGGDRTPGVGHCRCERPRRRASAPGVVQAPRGIKKAAPLVIVGALRGACHRGRMTMTQAGHGPDPPPRLARHTPPCLACHTPRRIAARTCRPHVHAVRVLCTAQQDLRRAVPARGDIVREDGVVSVVRVELRHAARKPKVRQLDHAVRVEQQIGRLTVGKRGMGVSRVVCKKSTGMLRGASTSCMAVGCGERAAVSQTGPVCQPRIAWGSFNYYQQVHT
eukprot:364915-Chlamydomonas_euryale.AAC.31